jgi:hypothetical protein
MKRIFLALTILVLAGLACDFATGNTTDPAPGPITNPVLPEQPDEPEQPTSRVLYEDDFSDPNSGWPASADADKAASYADGKYLIQAFTASQDVWAHPGEDFSDVTIEVDATKFSGPDNNDFGIICRFVDDNNFYFLMASSDGYQVIGKYQDGEASFLSSEQMETTSAVNQGSATNHLRADCVGSTLTLYINGQQVSTVTDTSFTSGDIGLTVGTFDEPNAAVTFDNFVVTEPQ